MSLDNEMDQMVRGNEKATLRAEVARLTADLSALEADAALDKAELSRIRPKRGDPYFHSTVQEWAAECKQTTELRATVARLTAELAAMTEERDGLAEKNRLLTLRHAKSGHDMDTAGQCDAGCLTCAAKKAEGRAEALTELLKTASITFDEDVVPLGYNASIEEAEVWLASVKSRAKAEGWAEGMREAARYFRDNDYAEESKITELEDLADAEEQTNA